jgi:hypothetical protein
VAGRLWHSEGCFLASSFNKLGLVMSTLPNPVLGALYSLAATRVMLMGSGELGKEVIIALQRLGV